MVKTKKANKIKAVLLSTGVIAASLIGGGAIGATLFPQESVQEVEVEVPVEVERVINNTVVEEKEVMVEVENPVNEKLLQYIKDNVDEDLTKELVLFEFGAQSDSEVYVEDNMVSLLRENDFFRSEEVFEDYRFSEASVWRVSDNKIDFHMTDDMRLDVSMDVRVRANKPNSNAIFVDFEVTVPFHRGEMVTDDIRVVRK